MTTRNLLLQAAQGLCNDFASRKDFDILLSHFSPSPDTQAIEYGEKLFAPFLGRTFEGPKGVREYFCTLSQYLQYENMRFNEYVVDVEQKKVAVVGQARFTWISTRETWDETFQYVLDFDDQGKVKRYQVWADSGAAYLAREGRLDYIRRHEGELPL
ncbi:hypothetical protein M422DRAFT_42439 [Sphaerobolus stellatus SS14]|nr:hypothetical protein M422DRAFT_42439 [Sphaerobolus stellatus SS14]